MEGGFAMHVGNEIKAMRKRMFNDEQLEHFLAERRQMDTVQADGTMAPGTEDSYDRAMAALGAALNPEQMQELERMNALFKECMVYAVNFGFARGCFALFQQFYTDELPIEPFQKFAVEPLLTKKGTGRHPFFYDRHRKANALVDSLVDQIPEANREHMLALEATWDGRIYSGLQQAFYLGYRFGLDSVDRFQANHKPISFAGKILITEYELGVTHTREEQEIWEED